MIGPTDTLYRNDLNRPMANADEVDYLLSVVNEYNGQRRLNPSDVTATWAGLRPLAGPFDLRALTQESVTNASSSNNKTPSVNSSTSKVSREHEIFDGPGSMIGIIGGKLTNYRIMANHVLEHLFSKFPELTSPATKISSTQRIMLGGWLDHKDFLTSTAAIAAKARRLLLEPATIDHLIATYGKAAQDILEILEKDMPLAERICPDFPPIMAEIPHCISSEMTVCLEDLLSRRIRLMQLHHRQCLEAAPKVARLMQKMLGWDDTRVAAELSSLEHAIGRSPW